MKYNIFKSLPELSDKDFDMFLLKEIEKYNRLSDLHLNFSAMSNHEIANLLEICFKVKGVYPDKKAYNIYPPRRKTPSFRSGI